ncbi:MAG: NUDIX domain-containing protein [Candidatus Magasanikbacteria bacterium]|nr:NUDIX domain-containing protein [Candidatus Magasanikbacteria bacterium]
MTAEKTTKIIAQKAIIRNPEGKWLILLRAANETAYPDLWDLPGGKLESGEEQLKNVQREVKEETGLQIKPEKIIGIYRDTLRNTPVEFVVYAVQAVTDQVTIGQEHSAYRWATITEISELPAMPYMRQLMVDFEIKN